MTSLRSALCLRAFIVPGAFVGKRHLQQQYQAEGAKYYYMMSHTHMPRDHDDSSSTCVTEPVPRNAFHYLNVIETGGLRQNRLVLSMSCLQENLSKSYSNSPL